LNKQGNAAGSVHCAKTFARVGSEPLSINLIDVNANSHITQETAMNKRSRIWLAVLGGAFLFFTAYAGAQHRHGGGWFSSQEKNPAVAAALSLQPLPIALGQFYVGDWEKGILFTTAQLALIVPAMVLLSENSSWGHHWYYDTDPYRRSWTTAERERFYYFIGGYVIVKVISAFDAGYSAERQNKHVYLYYNEQTRSVNLSLAIPLSREK
jgi:hypothetical protein